MQRCDGCGEVYSGDKCNCGKSTLDIKQIKEKFKKMAELYEKYKKENPKSEEFVTWDKAEYDKKTEEFLEKFNLMEELYEKHLKSKKNKSAR